MSVGFLWDSGSSQIPEVCTLGSGCLPGPCLGGWVLVALPGTGVCPGWLLPGGSCLAPRLWEWLWPVVDRGPLRPWKQTCGQEHCRAWKLRRCVSVSLCKVEGECDHM